MPLLTQILITLAGVVILAEFWLVFRTRADRQILEKLNNEGNRHERHL